MRDIILEKYEIRKSNPEKTEFIEYITERLEKSGYDREKDITVEEKGRGLLKSRNIVVGNPEEADILLSAHYDTCAVLPFPNLMSPTNPVIFIGYQIILLVLIFGMALIPTIAVALITENFWDSYMVFLVFVYGFLFYMLFGYRNKHTANDNTSGIITITHILEALPQEHRDKVCVIYFDNEEKGLLGSSFFYKKHRDKVQHKLLLNFDCVGDGEYVTFLSKKGARDDKRYSQLLEILEECAKYYDVKFLRRNILPMMFGSDQMHFDKGVGVCSLKKSPIGMYVARIHTPFDTKCREENVKFLACGVSRFIEQL